MALAESIFSALSASAAVGAIVGSGDSARIYPGQAPADTPAPYVVWHLIAATPDLTFSEASASNIQQIQFSCIAGTYLGARDLATAIAAALDNQTLAAAEVCLSCHPSDGYSEATDQFLRIVEAAIFAPAAA